MPRRDAFASFYLGAFPGGGDAMVLAGRCGIPQTTLQSGILVFLGVVASGISSV
ncbi:hypothetical protein ACNKHV_24320 [Shigella flexneri]